MPLLRGHLVASIACLLYRRLLHRVTPKVTPPCSFETSVTSTRTTRPLGSADFNHDAQTQAAEHVHDMGNTAGIWLLGMQLLNGAKSWLARIPQQDKQAARLSEKVNPVQRVSVTRHCSF